jgi:hypothetical protein
MQEVKLDLSYLKRLFLDLYQQLSEQCYFQEAFGFKCVDGGFRQGKIGSDIAALLFFKLRKRNLWPMRTYIRHYSEEDLFDIIEFCFECISKPIDEEGYFHAWKQCGWHYQQFDKETGQTEFRQKINLLLEEYEHPHELSPNGLILKKNESGLKSLTLEKIRTEESDDIKVKLERAVQKFRHHKSTLDDQLDVLRDLSGILEYLRPQAKKVITKKDEDDLFNIANNFGIRHHNKIQKTHYDKAIWYNWIFYYYLATIHALLRLINR